MSVTLMGPATGLTKSKLALATASEGDVLSGKTFYGGSDKLIRTGTMTNHSAYTSPINYGYSDSILYVRIPQGAYLTNASAGYPEINFTAGDAGTEAVLSDNTFSSGNAGINVSGTMTNNGTWDATIDPGGSVAIPAGYHNGNGKVMANDAHVVTKTGSWKINKNYNGSATLSTTTSVDYSDLGLTEAPQITVGLAGGISLYGQDNGGNYCGVSLKSKDATTAVATVSYTYVGTSIGYGSGNVLFTIVY